MKHIRTMKTTNKYLPALCCFLSITFSACEAKDSSSTPSPYPVYDSGVWADPLHSPEIYWLDNNRVIFKGSDEKEKTKHYTGKFNISIWELGKGVSVYAEEVKPALCYSDPVLYYVLSAKDPQGNEQYRYGRFGKEQTFMKPKGIKFYWDQMNCRLTELETILKERKGRAIYPLLDRHGYLDNGPVSGRSENTPTIFYRSRHLKGVTLPVRISHVDYYAFKDAYFFRGLFKPDGSSGIKSLWPAGTTDIMGWLYPDGRIETVVLPVEPWPDKKVPAGLDPILLHDGYLVMSGQTKSPYDAGTLGAYLLRDKKLTKVVGGFLKSLTVSPDGCKVAFVYYPYLESTLVDDPSPIRLKAVDLCPK